MRQKILGFFYTGKQDVMLVVGKNSGLMATKGIKACLLRQPLGARFDEVGARGLEPPTLRM
jgi:hypothetical protein